MSDPEHTRPPPDRNAYRRVCGWCGGTYDALTQDARCNKGIHHRLFTGGLDDPPVDPDMKGGRR